MTSELFEGVPARAGARPRQVFVWSWLPGASDPVVAGVVVATNDLLHGEPVLAFRYAASYLDRPNAISLFTPELPLTDQVFDPRRNPSREAVSLASCLRDAAPDAWGRRVINSQLAASPDRDLDETTYLLGSGSNRIGAMDFQERPDQYVNRDDDATLEQLMTLAELVEAGASIPASLAAAVQHGTSIGGARPKALLTDGTRQLVAKFSSSTDARPVVKAEAVSMLLAGRAGLSVPAVELLQVRGKDVLLVERFDRVQRATSSSGTPITTRRSMVSMLTVLGVTEMNARYSSYAQLAETIRSGPWIDVPEALREMFTRLVFSICVGNNDDHLRNHAAFWDGKSLELTPAYDLAPQVRNTNTSTQAIGITRDGASASQLRLCRVVAADFLLSLTEADEIIDHVRTTIETHWDDVCDQALVTAAERRVLMGREFLNPYIGYAQT